MSDDELVRLIEYAHSINLKVALKPTANCKNGTWRAYINFFDKDVHCEPKWDNWFASYTEFQLHYAEIAEKTGCEMFIAGCEMVMAERRERNWRELIAELRKVYSGLLSYNTDKYQEDNVTWWDCLDAISTSGYYPLKDWNQELDRIEKIVKRYNKPFFFAECGCKSTNGASRVPNDWHINDGVNVKEQADWYEAMFRACQSQDWVRGFFLWEWAGKQYSLKKAEQNSCYDVFGKPAEKVVKLYFESFK